MPSAQMSDADSLFAGPVVVAIPHSDDEILGCGEALAQIVDKSRVRFVYASNGALSPPARHAYDPEALVRQRRQEATRALASLGYPESSLRFLDLPDGQLSAHQASLDASLAAICREFGAQTLLAPFRLDSHADHLAVHRAAALVARSGADAPRLFEYFVYFRYRLLSPHDLRSHLEPRFLHAVHSGPSAAAKRRAIDLYTSQAGRYHVGQTRPVLDAALLDELVAGPELYLQADLDATRRIFRSSLLRVRLVQEIEPRLKRWKDRAIHSRSEQ